MEHLTDYVKEMKDAYTKLQYEFSWMDTMQKMTLLNMAVSMYNADHMNANINAAMYMKEEEN